MTKYVNFTDSAQTAIDSVFSAPQDGTVWPNQGTVEDTDARYLAFTDPASTLAGAQAVQNAGVLASFDAACTDGFSSSVLGTSYTYPMDADARANLTASYSDGLGVKLTASEWAASADWALNDEIVVDGQYYLCTTPGTSGTTAPTWPTTVGTAVTDGTAAWEIWTTAFKATNAAGVVSYPAHTVAQIIALGRAGKLAYSTLDGKYGTLVAEIAAATTVAAVQAITW